MSVPTVSMIGENASKSAYFQVMCARCLRFGRTDGAARLAVSLVRKFKTCRRKQSTASEFSSNPMVNIPLK